MPGKFIQPRRVDSVSHQWTFLNGEAVAAILPLRYGDRIQIGPYMMTVAIGEAEVSPDRPPSDNEFPVGSIAPESTAEPSRNPCGSVTLLSPSDEEPLRLSEPR
jgi:hypothetical protein